MRDGFFLARSTDVAFQVWHRHRHISSLISSTAIMVPRHHISKVKYLRFILIHKPLRHYRP